MKNCFLSLLLIFFSIGLFIQQSYGGSGITGKLTTTVTTPDGQKTKKTTNAKGDVIKVEEINRVGLIQYAYHSSGQPRSVTANGSTFSMEYDLYGRQTKLSDPNAGVITYGYNPFGELITQKDARGYTTNYKYDNLGRETEHTVNGKTWTSVYNAYGLDSVKNDDKSLSYKYDSYGRVQSMTKRAGADSYATSYAYNDNGQLQTRTYPSGFAVQYSYINGATTAIRKASNNAAIWELTAANAMGQITTCRHGGKFNVELGYDTYFNPTTKKLDGTSFAEQSVNSQTGNLSSRKVGTSSEIFGYDSQNRLTSWQNGSATYADNGNFQTKTGVGTYTYDPVRQHAVTSVTSVTSIPGNNQTIAYNEAGRATSIEEGDYRLELEYGVDDQRVKTFLYENDSLIKEKHFASSYEKVITGQTVKEISYISAPSGLTAIVVRQAGVDSLFYVYTDHQGSILQLADENGKIVEQRVYDPWGRERDPKNWNNELTDVGYRRTDRGYIGEEHLPEFGLINLNARLYDPVLGRFLSPDPFVQSPDLSQNFNRYSYAMNNPLIYTDPNGEFIWIVVGAIVGGIINVVIHLDQIHNIGQGLAAFGIGAAGGALAVVTGGAALATFGAAAGAGGFIGGAVAGAAAYTSSTMVTSVGNAAVFGDPMPTAKQFATGLGISMVTGGLINGTIAALNGRDFMTGNLPASKSQMLDLSKLPKPELPKNPELKGPEQALLQSTDPDNMYTLDNQPRFIRTTDGDGIQYVKDIRDPDFRANLVKASGIDPGSTAQAHHIFPVSEADNFAKAGIDVNRYGSWWGTTSHLQNAYQYNQAWSDFFSKTLNPTQIQIYNEALRLKAIYGF